MAEGQSPKDSPPPSPSDQQSSSSPPSSPSAPSSQESSSSSPPPPPQEKQSSPLPPPPQEKQLSPPPPQKNSSSGSSSSSPSLPPPPPPSPPPTSSSSDSQSSPPPPPPSPRQGSNSNNGKDNNGSKNNDNNDNNKDNGNNHNNKSFPPPPPSKSSDRGSNSPSSSLAPPKSGSDSRSSRDSGQDIQTIIGVVAGAGLLLIVMILFCICCCRKKRNKTRLDQIPYYGHNAFTGGKAGGDYYNSVSSKPYNQSDHVVNLPPLLGTVGVNITQSPPPPPGTHSSDLSSNFSGPHGPSLPPPHPSVALGFNKSTFTYDDLAAATQGFSQSQLLGQGGFGYVHKGILPNGKEIAVKSLKSGSGQGEREFQAEVEIISRVHHRYLVSLVGYCITGSQRMLVYEFLPNNTLEFHLHGQSGHVMDWPTRHKIALGSAKGLAYLHEDCHPRIIHRDIKTANILLDYNFEAKVADFGLAKLSQDNHTHVSTRIMGTFGYLAPEYASSGKLTEKSDTFSFGVMLLELITGRRPVDLSGDMEDSLVDWARPLCLKAAQDSEYRELVDPRLENYDPNEMASMVACAAAAIRHSARRRPKMSQIVRTLEGDASLDDLNNGIKPGQSSFFGSSTEGSTEYDASSYNTDMRRFRKVALDSREYSISEYGATNEYGLNLSSSSSEELHRVNSTSGQRL